MKTGQVGRGDQIHPFVSESQDVLPYPLLFESVFFGNFYTHTIYSHFNLAENVKKMSRRQRCTKMTHFCCGLLSVRHLQEQAGLGTCQDMTQVRSGVDSEFGNFFSSQKTQVRLAIIFPTFFGPSCQSMFV